MPNRPTTPTVRAELDRVEARPPAMTTALYRRYDARRVLLYVGISDWPHDRASGHGHNSLWAQFAASGTNQWFESRGAASAAEKVAIRDELPLFNRYHPAPRARGRLTAYLVANDRSDLLVVIKDWTWDYRGPRRRPGPRQAKPGDDKPASGAVCD